MLVEEFRKKLAQLQEDFKDKLPARIADIESAWRRARASPACGADWDRLIALTHSLTGSAFAMGMPALGDAARGLEQALVLRQKEKAELSCAETERFERLVAPLRQVLG